MDIRVYKQTYLERYKNIVIFIDTNISATSKVAVEEKGIFFIESILIHIVTENKQVVTQLSVGK